MPRDTERLFLHKIRFHVREDIGVLNDLHETLAEHRGGLPENQVVGRSLGSEVRLGYHATRRRIGSACDDKQLLHRPIASNSVRLKWRARIHYRTISRNKERH